MSEELAVWWRSPRNRNVRLLNAYGPTETVIAASFLEATSRESAGPLFERVAIGHPLGERALHVVDPDGRLAPVGVSGELLIAGEPILARGYLGRPDLTAERFLPDPFSPLPGARLYRTGDLGRYLPDGRREFLGRIDDQVKVRGLPDRARRGGGGAGGAPGGAPGRGGGARQGPEPAPPGGLRHAGESWRRGSHGRGAARLPARQAAGADGARRPSCSSTACR